MLTSRATCRTHIGAHSKANSRGSIRVHSRATTIRANCKAGRCIHNETVRHKYVNTVRQACREMQTKRYSEARGCRHGETGMKTDAYIVEVLTECSKTLLTIYKKQT
jgi:hypothetical protein